jgi:hypothetical protein
VPNLNLPKSIVYLFKKQGVSSSVEVEIGDISEAMLLQQLHQVQQHLPAVENLLSCILNCTEMLLTNSVQRYMLFLKS